MIKVLFYDNLKFNKEIIAQLNKSYNSQNEIKKF